MKNYYLLSTVFMVFISINCFNALAQITDPIPEKIQKSGIQVELEDFITVPASSTEKPLARLSIMRELDDGSGRLFVNDMRGYLYVIKNGSISEYLDLEAEFPNLLESPLQEGFMSFTFHPEFAINGKFYTAHTERADSGDPDFEPNHQNGIRLQFVVEEWTCDDPSSNTFSGTHRELFRADQLYDNHGVQEISFNNTASPGDEDYGLLFIAIGECGSIRENQEENLQDIGSFIGTIFRIDPLGNNSANGNYGIPASNPFVGVSGAIEEIWAYGFRDPHRFSWDMAGEHKMLIGDIGQDHIEEINIGVKGSNYGFSDREGTFVFNSSDNSISELPEDDSGYTYPVAQYDHDEGYAVVGGYVYRSNKIPALHGEYIFGDIVFGRIFHVTVDDLVPGSQQTIEELTLLDSDMNEITLLELVNSSRADLRFGIDLSGDVYILTKQDGKIRKMKKQSATKINIASINPLHIYPNPSKNGLFSIEAPNNTENINLTITDITGKIIIRNTNFGTNMKLDLSDYPKGIYWVHSVFKGKKYINKIIR